MAWGAVAGTGESQEGVAIADPGALAPAGVVGLLGGQIVCRGQEGHRLPVRHVQLGICGLGLGRRGWRPAPVHQLGEIGDEGPTPLLKIGS
jgi:hypothetical protein